MHPTVLVTAQATAEIETLPGTIQERVAGLLDRLRRWPAVSGVKALRGRLAGWYRLRTGDYRLRFRVDGNTVIVDKVAHRKDVYED